MSNGSAGSIMGVTSVPAAHSVDGVADTATNARDAIDFERLLAGTEENAPEASLLTGVQKAAAQFSEMTASLAPTGSSGAPEFYVEKQLQLAKSVTAVDALAKVVGSVSQGIRQITTMQ
ncbi:hypothetical protein PQR05_36405 [Paraburkholderia sediminicola]|uniref:hypothetical protein n=1 Tax=Paraburkholderia sediminicola TaxID=458836 RepID=UPI0038BDDD9F